MSNFYVNTTATRAYAGVSLRQLWRSPLVILLIAAVLLPHTYYLSQGDSPLLLVIGLLTLAFAAHILSVFQQTVLFNDQRPERVGRNLARALSAEVIRSLGEEKKVSSIKLLQAALRTKRGGFILNELGIDDKKLKAAVTDFIRDSISVAELLERAESVRKNAGEPKISAPSLLYTLFQFGGPFENLLNDLDLAMTDLQAILRWEKFHHEWYHQHHTWSPEKLATIFSAFGRTWVLGYTKGLDAISVDLSEKVALSGERMVVIQQDALKNVQHILSRSEQGNVLILGKPGVGKETLVENLAAHIRQHERKNSLPYTRVLLLQTELLLSATQNPEAVLLEALAAAQKSGRFILVLDNLSVLLKAGNPALIAVLSKFLQSPALSLIAIADAQEYHTLVKRDAGLDNQFEKVFLDDATDQDTMLVMMTHFFTLEEKRHMHLTYKALRSILELSKRYIGAGGFPGKAIGVLDDAVIAAKRRQDSFVTEADVREMISLKARMNVQEISADEKQVLLRLHDALSQKIIGQNDAIRAVVGTLKRARLDIHAGNRPLGTFLFLGPTGVGKTETAKVLAQEYFGSSDTMIRLDMNEFSSADSMKLIVGAPDTAELAEGFLARRVQERPFSLVLLDEIEKAHPNVLNAFLQILDEGMLTDSLGTKTDFRNTIIIATSNAGALFMRNLLRQRQELQPEAFKRELIDSIIQEQTFSPEFINRFDDVIMYLPLSYDDAKRVAIKMIDVVISDLRRKKGIVLTLDEGVVEAIVDRGYSQEFGARAMRRTVTDVLENFVADYLLRHDIKRGEVIHISRQDLQF